MVLRPATLCCFLLLVTLATSAKIPPENGHLRSSGIEKNANFAYLDFVPHSRELFVDDPIDDYLDNYPDDYLDWEEDTEQNSKNLAEFLLNILLIETQLEELKTNGKKIPNQEVSIVPMSGSGDDSDDEDFVEVIMDEMYPVTTTTEPPKPSSTEAVTTTIPATENPLSGFCKSLGNGNYLNPFDCKTSISCFNGITRILNCPTTSISDVQWNWCDFTRNAQNLPACN